MFRASRRQFLASVGQGMFVATVGYHTALDLGLARAATDAEATLDFGALEPLVDLMQSTEADKLLPILVARIRGGESLRTLVAAGALANARAFGGEDYVGFHTLMALAPSYAMSQRLPADRAPLPVLKVLYRNARRLQETGGADHHTLRPVQPLSGEGASSDRLREAVHRRDLQAAEPLFAALLAQSPEDAFNALLPIVGEAPEVHRVVLAHRAWDMLDLVGAEHAGAMLRQSVHYCVKNEQYSEREYADVRTLLPKLLDQHKLNDGAPGTRSADDAWVDQMSQLIFKSTPAGAADAVAAALAEGMSPEVVAESLSLAANQLVLRDSGRPAGQTQPNKPLGSVHGDSIGVHACDSAHAWRGIARVGNPRNRAAALILGAWQAAYDRTSRGGDFLVWEPRPTAEQLGKVAEQDGAALLAELEAAVRGQDQAQACAVAERYAEQGYEAQPAFDLLLRFATSEDGALHAEKYYRTTTDEYAATRPAFRGRQLVALARVTASEFGQPAPGYAEACGLLGVTA